MKTYLEIEALLEGSQFIGQGVIHAVQPGFLDGHPVSMLSVEIARPLFSQSVQKPKLIYIAYPNAKIQVNGATFCSGLRHPYIPRIGGRIATFLDKPIDRDGKLFFASPEMIFFEDSFGSLPAPPRLKLDPFIHNTETFDNFLKKLRFCLQQRL
ncbi:MAG: hypothetical protein QNK37_11495 [Acidobacteriota bacterium]|nr:hypothetical protein [Acidobacteriota bacterium]